MSRPSPLWIASLLLLGLAWRAPAATPADGPGTLAAYARLARDDLWPGFRPLAVPRAVFDGERTWLAGHPSPPAPFAPVDEALWVRDGRPDELTANTSLDLADTLTAGLLAPPDDVDEAAAVLLHEAFHVWQRQVQPGWSADEGALLVYPFDDPLGLALRRLETAMLREALAQDDHDAARARAAMVVMLRARRLARLPGEVRAYERLTELNEGLAQHVQDLALPRSDRPELPAAGFPVTDLRRRCYHTGQALALLLDRFHPDWRDEVGPGDDTALDERLLLTLDTASLPEFAIDEALVAAVQEQARQDVAALEGELQARREEHLQRPGWRLLVRAPGVPLLLQGFDPLNVLRVGEGEVLHGRWLALAGAGARLSVERPCLTSAVGVHPLFSGVREVLVTGLAEEPRAEQGAAGLLLEGGGVRLEARGAILTADRERRALTVLLAADG